ncbi:MAG: tetratricopeptide repeat protein [Candidatus Delongbacteria bacterium]|jgi:class 3 adenylate cyclase/predicted ATPase|nr:tetratricopeptide repeat protein [Candidatus Delongbacteria bacterium]
MLSKYLPAHFTEIYSEIKKSNFVRKNGSVMFADISGFTKMSEKLTSKGKEGSEEISRIINDVFEILISLVSSSGGSVYKFGGDAITVFFPDSIEKKIVLNTAIEMQKAIFQFSNIKTIAGTFSLKMKIGLAHGSSLIGQLGKEHKGFFIAGDTLDTACDCEHSANQGDIIVTKEFYGLIDSKNYEKIGKFYKVTYLKNTKTGISPEKINRKEAKWHKEFINDVLVDREMSGGGTKSGELRNCTVVFLNFTGVDYNKNFNYNVLNDFYTLASATVSKYNGFINKIDMGDKGNKLIMLFGAPIATEKNEEYALRAVEELRSLCPKEINIRIGINNGNIYFGVIGASHRREFTVMGNSVNLSARLMASAESNEIVVSSSIRNRVPEIEVLNERKLKLKGVKEFFEVSSFKHILETRKSKRFKLIGRKKEQIEYHNIIKKKKAFLINIKAEAGLGKSVLVNKFFEDRIKDGKCILVNCLSYTKNNSFYAVKEFIARFADVKVFDDQEIKLKKLHKLLKMIGEEGNTDLYASFLSWKKFDGDVSDPGLKDFFVNVTTSIFYKIIKNDKSILFVEDTHWMDSASTDFFRSLLYIFDKQTESGQIHFVFRPDQNMFPFEQDENTATITLQNLEFEDGKEFLLQKFNLVSISKKIYDQIYLKTKGNPFFIEEILLSLKNEGNFVKVSEQKNKTLIKDKFMSERDQKLAKLEFQDVKYKLKPSIKTITIPDNVNDMVLARIDKLDENCKTILKISSVIGRVFQFDILKQLQNLKEIAEKLNIKDSLFDLTKFDLTLFEETSENEYLFKHAITQEVAYETLLFSMRRKFHSSIAKLYEGNYSGNISDAYELLAYHYRHTNNKEKAKFYLLKSAISAKNKFSYKEAFTFLKDFRKYKMPIEEKADSYFYDIEMYNNLQKDKKAIEICNRLINTFTDGTLYNQKAKTKRIILYRRNSEYKKAIKVYKSINKFVDINVEIEANIEYVLAKIRLRDNKGIDQLIHKLEKMISKSKIKLFKAKILETKALKLFYNREFAEAIKLYKKLEKISSKYNLFNQKAHALLNLASSYGQLGDFIKASQYFEELFLEAKKIHNYELIMRSIDGLAKVSLARGDYKKAEKYIKDGVKLTDRTGKINIKELLLESLSNIRLAQGKYNDVLKLCTEREDIAKTINDNTRLAMIRDIKGDTIYKKGQFKKALKIYQENLAFSKKIKYIVGVGHSYGNIANCYAELGKIDESIEFYKKQIKYSQDHNDIFSEGKAMFNLAYTYYEDLKDIAVAKEAFQIAKDIFEKVGFKSGLDQAIEMLKEIEENK